MITHTLLQEKKRIELMLSKYQGELRELPKGRISEKKVNEKVYYYLKFRDGKRVVSKYVSIDNIEFVREQIIRREHIEAMIKSLLEEQRIADKALEGLV